MSLLNHENLAVQRELIRALRQFNSPRVVEALWQLSTSYSQFSAWEKHSTAVKSSGSILREIAESLAALGDERGEALLKSLEEADEVKAATERTRKASEAQALAGMAANMSDAAMVENLARLCKAYMSNDKGQIRKLEPIATGIGHKLNLRGGFSEMQRVFRMLDNMPGSRTLEMHWDGIGSWSG